MNVCGPASEYLFCILIAVGVIELWDRGRRERERERERGGGREEGEEKRGERVMC